MEVFIGEDQIILNYTKHNAKKCYCEDLKFCSICIVQYIKHSFLLNNIEEETKLICETCKKIHTQKLKKCGYCLSKYYCSKQCQKKDWNVHKSFCYNFGNNNLIKKNEYPKNTDHRKAKEKLLINFDFTNPILYLGFSDIIDNKIIDIN